MHEFIPPGTRFIALPDGFPLRRGGHLDGARVAYETWGTLDAARSNAILILTGLSPDAHAASTPENPAKGWWEEMIGPGKPIDTNRWFVVCVNSLGSCKGSTGPASADPATGQPYRLDFPDLSIEDCADAAAHAVRALGIDRLACLIGCSMGAMVALALLVHHRGIARTHLNMCGAARALPFSIAVRSLQREAIRLDPQWADGQYDGDTYPETGMRLARKLGVITYRSALEWDGRFGRIRLEEVRDDEPFASEFAVEAYLDGHANRFARSFDPNCYLYLGRAMDWFDIGEACPDGCESSAENVRGALAQVRIEKALVIGVATDILFPLTQQEEISDGLRRGTPDTTFMAMPSPQGHDAFLVDIPRFGAATRDFLNGIAEPRPADGLKSTPP